MSTTGSSPKLQGERLIVDPDGALYPSKLEEALENPPALYIVGDPAALLQPAIAITGVRKATPYGLACARRFGELAAQEGLAVVTGGARGIDAAASAAAIKAGGICVAVLGGGLDMPYPHDNVPLFQEIVDAGGAVVSEHAWDRAPLPYMFRARHRIIAGLADAMLLCEAGLPSGTFSAADDALSFGKRLMVVPGPITSPSSRGTNELLRHGAAPIVDDASFLEECAAVKGRAF